MTSSYGSSPINVKNLDHSRLGHSLRDQAAFGGELTLKNYRELAAMGHEEAPLKSVVKDAFLRDGLSVDSHLKNFLQQGLSVADITDPVKSQSAFDKMSIASEAGVIREEGGPIYREGYGFTPQPGQNITFQRADGSRYNVTGKSADESQGSQEFDPAAFMEALTASTNKTISEITSGFSETLKGLSDSNLKMFQDLRNENRLLLEKQAKDFAEQNRLMQIAQNTAANNMMRGSTAPDFRLGGIRGSNSGIGGFKRRLKITPSTSQGLSLAANSQSSNLLNI
jgi:hypothetical protein|tara:strand:+ start:52 stop:897 length:846 start_codon:yes stop_codon:yes gene_type:complete